MRQLRGAQKTIGLFLVLRAALVSRAHKKTLRAPLTPLRADASIVHQAAETEACEGDAKRQKLRPRAASGNSRASRAPRQGDTAPRRRRRRERAASKRAAALPPPRAKRRQQTMTEERLTPFMLFYCEVRDKVEKESPKLQPHEVSSEITRDGGKRYPRTRAEPTLYYQQPTPNKRSSRRTPRRSHLLQNPSRSGRNGRKDPSAPKIRDVSVYVLQQASPDTVERRENASSPSATWARPSVRCGRRPTPGEKSLSRILPRAIGRDTRASSRSTRRKRLAEQEAEVDSDDER